jgi:3'(2'), 5'-bisphosphate nucleotidase
MIMNYIEIFNEIAEKTLPLYRKYRKDIKSLEIEVKADKTLLTQADIEIQGVVVDTIKKSDKNANFIAEEKDLRIVNKQNKIIWVIDPIDGTRPFTEPNNHEFCCAVGILDNGVPVAAMIFMPEMGKNQTPILATALYETKEIFINGELYDYSYTNKKTELASTTRESGSSPSHIEEYLINSGVKVKHRTTSQSIDLLRTAIDISAYSDVGENHFGLFYRKEQKLWDGAAGMCFNGIVGKKIVDLSGKDILPFSDDFLEQDEPVSHSVIVAFADEIDEFVVKDFEKQIRYELSGLLNEKDKDSGDKFYTIRDICFLAWLCAIRTLPFIGVEGNFDCWKNNKVYGDVRQKYLLTLFDTLDEISDLSNSSAIYEAADAIDIVVKATFRDVRYLQDLTDTRSISYPFKRSDYLITNIFPTFIAAVEAADALRACDTAHDDDINMAYAVAVNATINAFKNTASVAENFGLRFTERLIDLKPFLLEDIQKIKSSKFSFNNDISIYGEIWDNFQTALNDVSCGYWGNWYANLFAKGFILDDNDKIEKNIRFNIPKEIKEQGAASVANYIIEKKKTALSDKI